MNFKRGLMISFIAGLSIFYLAVLFKGSTPSVTPAYRAFFLDQSTLYYARNNDAFVLPYNQRLAANGAVPFFSRLGWQAEVNQQGYRLLSDGAGLIFCVGDHHPEQLEVILKGTVAGATPNYSSPVTLAGFNSQVTGIRTSANPTEWRFVVPLPDKLDSQQMYHLSFGTKQVIRAESIEIKDMYNRSISE